jgi:hypothetical protein
MFVIVNIMMAYEEFVGMFMNYHHKIFYIPGSSSSLVTALKWKVG